MGGGQVMGIAGTSAATPVVAGVIAKLNEIRLGRGDKPLGFLNPWLYQAATENPQVFNDVTSGENNGGVFGGGRRVMGLRRRRDGILQRGLVRRTLRRWLRSC